MNDAEQSLNQGPDDLLNEGQAVPRLVGEVKPADVQRFLTKIVPVNGAQDPCWEWGACKDRKGYGKFWYSGISFWAHRFAFALFVGDIPPAQTVNHKCRNPSCVRPGHLEIMGRVENTKLGNHHRRIDAGIEEGEPF